MTGWWTGKAKRMGWFTRAVCGFGMTLTPLMAQSPNAVPVSSGPISTPYNTPAINAPVRVCLASSFGSPCSTAGVTLYSDSNVSQPINNPTSTNSQGIYNFYLNAVQYTLPQLFVIQIAVSSTVTYQYNFLLSVGDAGQGPFVRISGDTMTGALSSPLFSTSINTTSLAGAWVGDSIMAQWNLATSFPSLNLTNLGEGGDTCGAALARMPSAMTVAQGETYALLCGTNDALDQTYPLNIGSGAPVSSCSSANYYQQYIDYTNNKIYVCPTGGSAWVLSTYGGGTLNQTQSNIVGFVKWANQIGISRGILFATPPFSCTDVGSSGFWTPINNQIKALNVWKQAYAQANGIAYADIYTPLTNADGSQNTSLFSVQTVGTHSSCYVHPNASGQAAMTTVANAALALAPVGVVPNQGIPTQSSRVATEGNNSLDIYAQYEVQSQGGRPNSFTLATTGANITALDSFGLKCGNGWSYLVVTGVSGGAITTYNQFGAPGLGCSIANNVATTTLVCASANAGGPACTPPTVNITSVTPPTLWSISSNFCSGAGELCIRDNKGEGTITTVTVPTQSGCSGWALNDALYVTGGSPSTWARYVVSGVSGGCPTAVTQTSPGTGYVVANNVATTAISPSTGVGFVLNITGVTAAATVFTISAAHVATLNGVVTDTSGNMTVPGYGSFGGNILGSAVISAGSIASGATAGDISASRSATLGELWLGSDGNAVWNRDSTGNMMPGSKGVLYYETSTLAGVSGRDLLYGSSSDHRLHVNLNAALDVPVGYTLASGTATMTTSAIGSGACGATVTVASSNVLATDVISWTFNAAPTTNDGLLKLNAWVTAGNVNFNYCNPTAGSITPDAATINWRVAR